MEEAMGVGVEDTEQWIVMKRICMLFHCDNCC